MLLIDDLPPFIKNDSDIQCYISAFNRWNADDSKDISPVFPGDLLEFTQRFVGNLSSYIEQRNSPPSPTVANSEEQDHDSAEIDESSYTNSCKAQYTAKTTSGTLYEPQSNSKGCASGACDCTSLSSRMSRLEASVSFMKDELKKFAGKHDGLKQGPKHNDGELESCDHAFADVPRKRRRIKVGESMGPAKQQEA